MCRKDGCPYVGGGADSAPGLHSVQEALAEQTAGLDANRDGKAENDLSALQLTQNELTLQDAPLKAGSAAVQQAEDNAAAAGRTLTESEKFNVFRDTLVRLKEQFPQLSSQIDGYVARLDAIPGQKNTTVRAHTLGAAQAIEAHLRALGRIPRNISTAVFVSEIRRDNAAAVRGPMQRATAGGSAVLAGPGTMSSRRT